MAVTNEDGVEVRGAQLSNTTKAGATDDVVIPAKVAASE